jgi:UDP-N-acetylglucosamine enolpyruvyl transferase
MNLKTLENSLLKSLGESNYSYTDSGFLLRDGRLTAKTYEHNAACERIGSTLSDYLNAGGCRLKVIENATIAIETGKALSDEQIERITDFIKANKFSYLVYFQADTCKQIEINDFNKVRPYQFQNGLESKKKDVLIKNY